MQVFQHKPCQIAEIQLLQSFTQISIVPARLRAQVGRQKLVKTTKPEQRSG
jgi:hypothetical protein